jgi:hypothetical protein
VLRQEVPVTFRFPLRASAALLLFLHPAARAEEPLPITPEELVERALASDPRLAALDARVAAARVEPRAARLWANPALSLRRESVPAPAGTADDDYLELTLPLDVSGRRGHRAASLAAGADAISGDAERGGTSVPAARGLPRRRLPIRADVLRQGRASSRGSPLPPVAPPEGDASATTSPHREELASFR